MNSPNMTKNMINATIPMKKTNPKESDDICSPICASVVASLPTKQVEKSMRVSEKLETYS